MKKFLLTLALVAVSATAFAANANESTTSEKSHGPYVTNKFWDNWYVNIGAGVNTWGRLDKKDMPYHYRNQVLWMIEGSVGKWFTPIWGARVHGQGTYGIHVYSPYIGAFVDQNRDGNKWGKYNSRFGYGLVDVDGMANLSNWIGGYKETRVYNAVAIVGCGVAWSRGHDTQDNWGTNTEFAMSLGLNNVFRLSKKVDLNLELKSMFVRQQFAGDFTPSKNPEVEFGKVGVMPSITFGVTYKIGKSNWGTAAAVAAAAAAAAQAETAPYQDRIKDLENELGNANDRADKLAKDLKDCNNRPAAATASRPTGTGANGANLTSGVSYAAFFKFDNADVSKKDMINIGYIADMINANPDQKYTVYGYADQQTGSADYNMQLSQKRADNVKKALVEKFGCNGDQIEAKGFGGSVDKYGVPELNRCAVVM